jgi:hypothetical protein
LILHHGPDLLTSDQRATLYAGSDDGHFDGGYLRLEKLVRKGITNTGCGVKVRDVAGGREGGFL